MNTVKTKTENADVKAAVAKDPLSWRGSVWENTNPESHYTGRKYMLCCGSLGALFIDLSTGEWWNKPTGDIYDELQHFTLLYKEAIITIEGKS